MAAAGGAGLRRGVTTRTLAKLDCKLEIQCRCCARSIVADAWELRRMFPRPVHLQAAGRRLRCARCGANDPRMWVWVMGWTRGKHR